MKKAISKQNVWSEFSSGMGGWEVGLNTTSFHHDGLFLDYARAYRKAARRLFEVFRQAAVDHARVHENRDMDAHPIAFLYRHAIEVYLKTIFIFGNQLLCLRNSPLKDGKAVFKRHKLNDLLVSAKDVCDLIGSSDLWVSSTFHSFADLERVVRDLDSVEYDALRYPVEVKKGDMVALLPEGLHFNILTFTKTLDALLDILDTAAKRTWDTVQVEGMKYVTNLGRGSAL